MKKLLFVSALASLVMFGSCGGNKDKAEVSTEAESATFYETQPLESGEYRAVSFTYDEEGERRNSFDGRMLVAVTPESSGIYIYENGNRTKFEARVSLSQPFEKTDSVYTASDSQNQPVVLVSGSESDTLKVIKGGKGVKIAFEKKPLNVLTPEDAWKRITDKLQ